ncbi:hypothetical protein TUBRATIS_007480 [Tubulinosema ratisbonensis]|uniref:Uncharacterized protein n=1 Tax=Tubulinosema ratisbonensis TaxID=291195 RepID=A0A437ANG8_9MICR|nr:hypothetical protein TUBRATIS_007480 [Tubulinosema ratisbonensis]
MNYESLIIFVIFSYASKRRLVETNLNTSETYCDDSLVNNEKRLKLNDNKTNLSNQTEDKSLEDFLLNQPTNYNSFSLISANNQETELEINDNLFLDNNFTLTEDLQEFVSNQCDSLLNLLNQGNLNFEDRIDLTKEQPEPSKEPEIIVIDSDSQEETESNSSDSLDLRNEFIKKVLNLQPGLENPLLDLGSDVFSSDVLNLQEKNDSCEEVIEIDDDLNKNELVYLNNEKKIELQNKNVTDQNISLVNDNLSNSVLQDLEKMLEECINNEPLRVEEEKVKRNEVALTENCPDLINNQQSSILYKLLQTQNTSTSNQSLDDSFIKQKEAVNPLATEQNSSDSSDLNESYLETNPSMANQRNFLENQSEIDIYDELIKYKLNKMMDLFKNKDHPFKIGLDFPIRPGLVIYRIEERTPFRFYWVSRYFMNDYTIRNKFWRNQQNKHLFVQKMSEVLEEIYLDISFTNFKKKDLFSDNRYNFTLSSQGKTEQETVLKLVKLFNKFIESYFFLLKKEGRVTLGSVTKRIEICHKKYMNITFKQIFQYVLDRSFDSENYEKIFFLIPELKFFYEIFIKNIVNAHEMRLVYFILEYILFKFEFLKENILFEIMKDKRDFTKSNTLNSFLLGTKVLILLMIYNNFTDKMYDSLVLQLTISSFFIFLRIFNLKYANMFVLNDVYLLKNIGPPGFYASFEVKRAVYCGSKRILGIENPVSMNFKSLIYLKNTKSIFEVLYESISCKNLKKDLEEYMKNEEMFFTKEKFGDECLFYKNLLKSTTEKFISLLNK